VIVGAGSPLALRVTVLAMPSEKLALAAPVNSGGTPGW